MSSIEVRILKDALVHNLNVFRGAQKLPVAPVLKSNAYGHGILEVGRVVAAEQVPFACVNMLSEARVLRDGGVSTSLLIIGYTPLEDIRANELPNIAFGVISIEELRRLAHAQISATLHLEVDTGMHRHGIMPEEIDEAVNIISSNPQITLEGMYSHLADADAKDSILTQAQIARWNAAVTSLRAKFPELKYYHLSATTGVAFAQGIEANVARLGIGLYGFNVSLAQLELKPALEMRTCISSVRTVPKGERVGYNGTFVAPEACRVASVLGGYFEGIDRRLSGTGSMLVAGKPCLILGRVSMNITSLDVTGIDAGLDAEVTAISANPADPNSIENIARLCGTIPYEILVHIPSELPRVVV